MPLTWVAPTTTHRCTLRLAGATMRLSFTTVEPGESQLGRIRRGDGGCTCLCWGLQPKTPRSFKSPTEPPIRVAPWLSKFAWTRLRVSPRSYRRGCPARCTHPSRLLWLTEWFTY